jgi:hypothetical protein
MKRMMFYLSLLLLLALISAIVTIVLQGHKQPHLYTYQDSSSALPEQIKAGGYFLIRWRSYPDASRAPLAPQSAMITLTTMLIKETDFTHELCGAYRKPIILDVVRTTNRLSNDVTHNWYLRTLQIPIHQQAGVYELVRQVSQGSVSSCVGNRLVIISS